MSPYQSLALEIASGASKVRLRINGTSMAPLLQDGESVIIQPVEFSSLAVGDLVAFRNGQDTITHRVVQLQRDAVLTLGDNLRRLDPTVKPEMILGRVVGIEKNGRNFSLFTRRWTFVHRFLAWLGWQVVASNRPKFISNVFRGLFLLVRKLARTIVFL